jgi:hypothetical protein
MQQKIEAKMAKLQRQFRKKLPTKRIRLKKGVAYQEFARRPTGFSRGMNG